MKDYQKLNELREQLNDMPWPNFDKLLIQLASAYVNGSVGGYADLVDVAKDVGRAESFRDMIVKENLSNPEMLDFAATNLKSANNKLKKVLKKWGA